MDGNSIRSACGPSRHFAASLWGAKQTNSATDRDVDKALTFVLSARGVAVGSGPATRDDRLFRFRGR
jgi:hypothetical protein